MTLLMDKPKYEVTQIILSKTGLFCLNEVMEDIQRSGLQMSADQVLTILNNLIESGIIVDNGFSCSLSSFVR
jgi:predicted transcriptional regulator